MSVDFCDECDVVIEGMAITGVEIIINTLKGTQSERYYIVCPYCGSEASSLASVFDIKSICLEERDVGDFFNGWPEDGEPSTTRKQDNEKDI